MMGSEMENLPVAITCGDPSGVGPELIERLLDSDRSLIPCAVVIGPEIWVSGLAKDFGVAVLGVGPSGFELEFGAPLEAGARVALLAMEAAAEGCRTGRFRGVVTAPVSKFWLSKVGFCWPGQTEFFADAWGGEPTMAFVGESLRVVLATWHIPLSRCLRRSMRRPWKRRSAGQKLLRDAFGVCEPRIGVCGLNPHAGENGILGREELEVLDPVLDQLRVSIPGLSKCLPGDTVFFASGVVSSMWLWRPITIRDWPQKTLEFDQAVNVTLGLPYVRTSPDHGTAYDLAGRHWQMCRVWLRRYVFSLN